MLTKIIFACLMAVHSTSGQDSCTDIEDPLESLGQGFWNASRVEFGSNGRDGKLVAVDLGGHPFENAFFEGDSYLIQFSKQKNGRPEVLYYWQGASSDTFEKGASAILTVQLDDEIGGAAKQARVEMGKEPKHFLDMFDGAFITLLGGLKKSTLEGSSDDNKLFQVTGTCNKAGSGPQAELVRTNEVNIDTDSLKEDEVYIYLNGKSVKIYEPEIGASEDETSIANKVAGVIAAGQTPAIISNWNEFKAQLA